MANSDERLDRLSLTVCSDSALYCGSLKTPVDRSGAPGLSYRQCTDRDAEGWGEFFQKSPALDRIRYPFLYRHPEYAPFEHSQHPLYPDTDRGSAEFAGSLPGLSLECHRS